MNDNDGTITSSPGPMPSTTIARCKPVVHDDTATPWRAPTTAATAVSNSATRGPCATQPDATAAAAGTDSSGRRNGFITGIMRVVSSRFTRGCAFRPPPLDEAAEALFEADRGLEAEQLACSRRVGEASGHRV